MEARKTNPDLVIDRKKRNSRQKGSNTESQVYVFSCSRWSNRVEVLDSHFRSPFKRFYFNSRSVANKYEELREVQSENLHFILLTGTWLNRTISDSLLSPGSVYNVFRCDRKEDKRGGGAAVLGRNSIPFANVCRKAFDVHCELVCVDFFRVPSSCFCLIVVYRAPRLTFLTVFYFLSKFCSGSRFSGLLW